MHLTTSIQRTVCLYHCLLTSRRHDDLDVQSRPLTDYLHRPRSFYDVTHIDLLSTDHVTSSTAQPEDVIVDPPMTSRFSLTWQLHTCVIITSDGTKVRNFEDSDDLEIFECFLNLGAFVLKC